MRRIASLAVPYAGINRIRFEGLFSGREATPRLLLRRVVWSMWTSASSQRSFARKARTGGEINR